MYLLKLTDEDVFQMIQVVLKDNGQHIHLNGIMNILHNYHMVVYINGNQTNGYLMLTSDLAFIKDY